MKTSTEIGSCAGIVGEEKAVEYIAKAGFDAWDFSMISMFSYDSASKVTHIAEHPFAKNDYLAFARRLKKIGLDNGIVCNQSHAPFPVAVPEIRSYLKRAIECTAEAGGKICIIHPDNNKSPIENAEMYWELLPFAKECGISIATENMWNWDKEKNQSCFAACATPKSFCEHVDVVHDENMCACLDIGHAEMRGSDTTAVEMIKALGHRLKALHIHDNDLWHDTHQLPFTMKIDFVAVISALKSIGYSGYLTLEAISHLQKYSADNVFEGVKEMAQCAKQLSEMFENA